MLDEIKLPTIVITDASDISNLKRVRYFSRTSVASSDTKRTCRGGARVGAGRQKKTSTKKVKRSLKKNKRYGKAKRRVRCEKDRHSKILARKLSREK